MALLPIYKDEMLFDGSYIHALPFCLKNCKNDKCLAHYRNMISKTTGFYTCPYGLSTFVYNVSCDTTFIFSGLRERSTYRKKQAAIAQSDNRVFNPVLDAEELVSLAKNECEYQQEKFGLSQKMEEVNELLHEARKLNGQIKTECDIIWENSASGTEYSVDELLGIIRNIHIYSFIVYNRFQYFDTVLNPALSVGATYNAVIFKKLDKMRKLLKGYSRKNVWISLDTQSTYNYRIHQSFETLLFIILLKMLYKISDLRFTLHLGAVSREQCTALLPTYTQQVEETQTRLTHWHQGTTKRLSVDTAEIRRKRGGWDKAIHFIPGLINDAWNFCSISERTAGMIDSQVGGHNELHHDSSDLYVEDVQLISKDGKVYYLPSHKK